MGNYISNDRVGTGFDLSNGSTDVLLSVLLLAGSDLANTLWEKELVTWLAEHDQGVFGMGVVGFDLAEIAWDRASFIAQKQFLLRTIDRAMQRHRWSVLGYDPPHGQGDLVRFRSLVEAFDDSMVDSQQLWKWRQAPDSLAMCSRHAVYQHANGCLLCHAEVS